MNGWKDGKLNGAGVNCHIVGCSRTVLHAIYPRDNYYDDQYFCPLHMAEEMASWPDRSFVIEPIRFLVQGATDAETLATIQKMNASLRSLSK